MTIFKKKHPPVGAKPGTLMISREAPKPVISVIWYDQTHSETHLEVDVEKVPEFLKRDGINWVDVHGLGDESIIRRLGEIFSIHPLALEDVANIPQRPKVESYGHHQYYVTRMAMVRDQYKLETEQVSFFVGENYVLTFQERPGDVFNPVRARIRRGGGNIREHGTDYLGYALMDTIVDAFYPVLEKMGDYLEDLEEEAMTAATPLTLKKIHRIKRELLAIRRAIWPQREAINMAIRDETIAISPQVRVFLRDVYDHCVQIIDVLETYRELAAGLMDVYLSTIGMRQNEVMKVLTIMASIFIPLTFLAGIFGMNFQHMPELGWGWAYPFGFWIAIVAITAAMVFVFRRKGWLGTPDVMADEKDDID
jgi:magnesium transporter